jgi:hypothetical protein
MSERSRTLRVSDLSLGPTFVCATKLIYALERFAELYPMHAEAINEQIEHALAAGERCEANFKAKKEAAQ